MSVNHCGLYIGMSEQFLKGIDISAIHHEMTGEGVTKIVKANLFIKPSFQLGFFKVSLRNMVVGKWFTCLGSENILRIFRFEAFFKCIPYDDIHWNVTTFMGLCRVPKTVSC